MWRVLGSRVSQKLGNIEKVSFSSLCGRNSRPDNVTKGVKHGGNGPSSGLTLNRPVCLLRNQTAKSFTISKNYSVSCALRAKNNTAVEQKDVAKDEKCDILEKIKRDLFKDDPELKTTIVEMYEDFDDRVTSPGKDEQQDKKADFEAKVASDAIPYSLQERFQVYRDSDAEIILDDVEQMKVDQGLEEDAPFTIYRQKKDKMAGLTLERGVEGVFDIGEFVDILRKENARDICVIAVPPELHYTDYMVIMSALSPRHVRAMTEFLRKLHKRKKAKEDKFVIVEGDSCVDWQVLDMGNIVLHIFMPETRLRYDLETLWSVGHQFDDLTQRPPVDSVFEALQSHLRFLDDMQPANNESLSVNKTIS